MKPEDVPDAFVELALPASPFRPGDPHGEAWIRRILAATLPGQARTVQAWMGLDLHTALGLPTDHGAGVVHQGRRSWGDWWAELLARVRALSAAQDAPTAPVQPATPATPATETTTGTGGDTDELSALCAELSARIRKAVRITPGDDLLRNLLDDTDPTAYLRLSGAEAEDAAHAVLPYVTLWQGRAEQAERECSQQRLFIDDLKQRYDVQRSNIADLQAANGRLRHRAETAERERDQYLDALFHQGQLHEQRHPGLSKRPCTNCVYFRELRQDPHYAAAHERWRTAFVAAIEAGRYIACRTPDQDGQ